MKFNEWITQNKDKNLKEDLGMQTREDPSLIESQLEQWINRLVGLLHTSPNKQKLMEKVINELQKRI
jgi:hypothetical protein